MNNIKIVTKEEGATLLIGLIMLLMFTLMVGSAFTISTVNLKSVGNMQLKEEATAAANLGLEVVFGTPFFQNPQADSVDVDINNNGLPDYVAETSVPVCVRATVADVAPPSSVTLPVMASSTWNTVWDIESSVSDTASGTAVTVRAGVRVLLSESQKNAVCP